MYLTLSQKTKITPPVIAATISSRYSWLSLDLVEPNIGVAPALQPGETITYLLSSNSLGKRGWTVSSFRPYKYANLEEELSIVPVEGKNFVTSINSLSPLGYASTILNGQENTINIDFSFIGTGNNNSIIFNQNTPSLNKGYNYIGSGSFNNLYDSNFSQIFAGTNNNIANSSSSSIILGANNKIDQSYNTVIVNGEENTIKGEYNSIGVGGRNNVTGLGNFTGVGDNNKIQGINNSVVNGNDNTLITNTSVQVVTSFEYNINYNNIPQNNSDKPENVDYFSKAVNLYVEKIDSKYYAYVGTPFENASAGKVDIYEVLQNNALSYIDTLSNSIPGSFFGYHIRSNSESKQLYISAPNLNNKGAVYCYDVDIESNSFTLNQTFNTNFVNEGSYFGHSFAVSPRSLLIGAPFHNNGRGVAFLFKKDMFGAYVDEVPFRQILEGDSNLQEGENFGFSVDMSYSNNSEEENLPGVIYIGSPNKNMMSILNI
jgi:hypothetical protein